MQVLVVSQSVFNGPLLRSRCNDAARVSHVCTVKLRGWPATTALLAGLEVLARGLGA